MCFSLNVEMKVVVGEDLTDEELLMPEKKRGGGGI